MLSLLPVKKLSRQEDLLPLGDQPIAEVRSEFEVDGVGDVVTDAFKMVIPQEMADVVLAAGEKIVEAEDILPLGEKPLAEVRSEKTGAAGDENPLHVACPS